MRASARIGARLADTGQRPEQAADTKTPPAARTRLAATVRPLQQNDPAELQQRRSAAFVAQSLAQETLPEDLSETPLGQRAGYAAYAAAGGTGVQVLGPAYAGVGLVV